MFQSSGAKRVLDSFKPRTFPCEKDPLAVAGRRGTLGAGRASVESALARAHHITPWIKVAHLAESFNVKVCPDCLMELHVSLCAAVPNSSWVEYIPQLDSITRSRIDIDDGFANP